MDTVVACRLVIHQLLFDRLVEDHRLRVCTSNDLIYTLVNGKVLLLVSTRMCCSLPLTLQPGMQSIDPRLLYSGH